MYFSQLWSWASNIRVPAWPASGAHSLPGLSTPPSPTDLTGGLLLQGHKSYHKGPTLMSSSNPLPPKGPESLTPGDRASPYESGDTTQQRADWPEGRRRSGKGAPESWGEQESRARSSLGSQQEGECCPSCIVRATCGCSGRSCQHVRVTGHCFDKLNTASCPDQATSLAGCCENEMKRAYEH